MYLYNYIYIIYIYITTTSLTFHSIKRDFITVAIAVSYLRIGHRFIMKIDGSSIRNSSCCCALDVARRTAVLSPSPLSNPDPDSSSACYIYRAICIDGFVTRRVTCAASEKRVYQNEMNVAAVRSMYARHEQVGLNALMFPFKTSIPSFKAIDLWKWICTFTIFILWQTKKKICSTLM